MSELFGAVNRPATSEGEGTKADRPARMVHFWPRRCSSAIHPAMPQPQERPARSEGRSAGVVAGGGGGGGGSSSNRGGRSSGGKTGGSGGGGGGSAGAGLCLLSRLGQYKRQQHEQQKRRVAEKELDSLHHRIDKLLAKMEEHDTEWPVNDDEECVVCLAARATMQTFPCEHKVVCRKCFIRTIQVAVAQRSLPLRCVLCRARILKLRHSGSGSSPLCVTEPTLPPSAKDDNNNARTASNNYNSNNSSYLDRSSHRSPAARSPSDNKNATPSPAALPSPARPADNASCRKSKSRSPLHWFASHPPSPPIQIPADASTALPHAHDPAGFPPPLIISSAGWMPEDSSTASSGGRKDRSVTARTVAQGDAQDVTVAAKENLLH